MNRKDYVKHYDEHYQRMGETGAGQLVWEPQYQIWLKAGYKPSMSVLDYGCGVGVMLEAGIKDYLGVDISSEAIRLAKKRYPGHDFRVLEMGDLMVVPRDMAVAQSVFTHIPKAYVSECLQDVKRNFTEFALIDILLGEDDVNDLHVRRFSEGEWLDCLWKNDLAGERIGEHDFVGYNHIYYKVTHD